jgi:glutamate 5-kinase
LIGADLLVLVTDVDGLYDAPPSHAGAKRISLVPDVSRLGDIEIGGVGSSGVGSGGMVTKIEAARIATGAGVNMLLTTLVDLPQALEGADVGTIFNARTDRKPSRLLWLAHAATPHGRLILDKGATTAIKERGTSLLAAGVSAVEGDFIAGDTVELLAPTREVIARGLVAFDSSEIPGMLGKSTKQLAQELGPEYERELVHRDDLVLL